ncbi:MAG: lipoyl synthase [Candidatus Omnitrophica bacterium]|nr:lipoyl synthase [Candidatus Omnitrophota bacterium]MBU1925183.1 lipoyl synthase [Candidatus Omnitrophota bacterium]
MLITDTKPHWLNKKISLSDTQVLSGMLGDLKLNTVCQKARCPNIGECFKSGVATFLILGDICTRSCRFCAVKKGKPSAPDKNEPCRIEDAVKKLNLKHVVITSVTRDDIADGGAGVFAETISGIKNIDKNIIIEVLVPDFKARLESLRTVIAARPEIFAHNLESVPRLYKRIRPHADYQKSLLVLESVKEMNSNIYTKSGLMLGLGEREEEVEDVLRDLRRVKCDFLSVGQYLCPSRKHFPVQEFIEPEKFDRIKIKAQRLGFLHIESGPYIRSSYRAQRYETVKKREVNFG